MTNNRIVIACLLSWLAFIPGVTWPPLLYFLDIVNALGFTFGFAVMWRYTPGCGLGAGSGVPGRDDRAGRYARARDRPDLGRDGIPHGGYLALEMDAGTRRRAG